MDETGFWELIGRLEAAAEDYSHAQDTGLSTEVSAAGDRVQAVKVELQEWLEAVRDPPWLDPVGLLMGMSPEDRERIASEAVLMPWIVGKASE